MKIKVPVFIGRDNPETIRLYLVDEAGTEVSASAFLAAVTRIVLATESVTVDSATDPTLLSLNSGASTLTMKLGSKFSAVGTYAAQLVFYTATYPNGYVWIDRYNAVPSRGLKLVVAAGS